MKMNDEQVRNSLSEKGLRVTPQRMAILKAVYALNNHPTAEQIIEFVRRSIPSVATGTVYHILDTLVANRIISRVKTDHDIMRYEGITENHHHLYCSECDLIEDYIDEDLDKMLSDYFKNRPIPGFKLENIVLQIRGTFNKC